MPPLSLYVHLPWCVQKCPYCDFNSFTAHSDPPKTRYVNALKTDLAREAERAVGRPLISVFLGGGTPSFFSPDEIAAVLDAVREHFVLAPDVEITMEANPGTVECGDPAGYRAAGVNRLSIGAQSFNDEMLKTLGRIHGSDDIRRAFDDARDAGFDNINLDVMHSLPGQTPAAACDDIEAAVGLEPEHISWYQLTLEPNTVFFSRPPPGIPGERDGEEIVERGGAILRAAGFEQVEVSAWSKPGRACRHNLNYWQFGDYLASGAGAHGKLTLSDGPARYVRPANPTAFMLSVETNDPPALTPVNREDRLFEYMLMALRLPDGFSRQSFESVTGLSSTELDAGLADPIRDGLLETEGTDRVRPTDLGFRFLNDLQARFLA